MVTVVARVIRLTWVVSVALALVALIAIGVAVALIIGRAPTGAASTTSPSPLALGTPAQVGSMRTTATAVRIVPTDPSHLPSANTEFIAVSVQMTDIGSAAVAYSMNDFALRDQAGIMYSPDIAASSLNGVAMMPIQQMMQPGRRMTGSLVFEIPMSDHTATLLWQPSAGGVQGAASWMMSI